jgi:hypothetical protein
LTHALFRTKLTPVIKETNYTDMKHSSSTASTASATVTALFGLLTATIVAATATIAAHAPAAHAQGTPFGERAGGGGSDAPAPQPPPPATEETSPASPDGTTPATTSPLLRELAALNAKRASYVAAGMSDRNRRDISALSFLKKRAQSSANIDALKAIAAAEADIGKNRRIFPANLQNKDLQKQYDSLRDTRAKHITATVKTAANRLKPDYEKLLKRAIALEKYGDAEAIKRAIGAIEGGGAQRFVGTWENSGTTFTLREGGKWKGSWSIKEEKDRWNFSAEEKLFIGAGDWCLVEEDENTLVEISSAPGRKWRRVK